MKCECGFRRKSKNHDDGFRHKRWKNSHGQITKKVKKKRVWNKNIPPE